MVLAVSGMMLAFVALVVLSSYIVQMFKNSFWSSRSSSWNKDLLLHVNPYKTLENVHTKQLVYFLRPFQKWKQSVKRQIPKLLHNNKK